MDAEVKSKFDDLISNMTHIKLMIPSVEPFITQLNTVIPTNISLRRYDDLCLEKTQFAHTLELYQEASQILVNLANNTIAEINHVCNKYPASMSIQDLTQLSTHVKTTTSKLVQLNGLYKVLVGISNDYARHMGIKRFLNITTS